MAKFLGGGANSLRLCVPRREARGQSLKRPPAGSTGQSFGFYQDGGLFLMSKRSAAALNGKKLNAGVAAVQAAAELKTLSLPEASRAAPSIAFTDSDFRRILGRPELRSKKIFDIVNYLPTIIMDFTNFPGLSVRDAEGNERWIEYTNLRTNFVTIFSEKKVDRKRTRGTRPGQGTLYEIYFTTDFGLAFLANMKRCQFVLMPKRLFSLSARAQELFFAMSWRRRNEFRLTSLAALFGWTRMDIRARHYRKAVRHVLDELKRAGFVSGWTERENRDGETVFRVTVARKYLTTKKPSN
jgi:hypothetical protein